MFFELIPFDFIAFAKNDFLLVFFGVLVFNTIWNISLSLLFPFAQYFTTGINGSLEVLFTGDIIIIIVGVFFLFFF